jgi:hypothetical protein
MTSARRRRGSFAQDLGFEPDEQVGSPPAEWRFDNSGKGSLRVPGFSGIPLDAQLPAQHRFAHAAHDWAQPRLTAREIAMLRLMNDIAELEDWKLRVREERPLELRHCFSSKEYAHLISNATWDWCMTELRDKATDAERKGLVLALDSASCVVKTDDAISAGLLQHLHSSFERIRRTFTSDGGHAGSISKLVDPDMFSLVFGKTKVLADGGLVGLKRAVETIGKGTPAPIHPWADDAETSVDDVDLHVLRWGGKNDGVPFLHSHTAQWLPCEVSLADGKPKIASYINNLHPMFHAATYSSVERVIGLSLQHWSEVLLRRDEYRKAPRIHTYGVQWQPPYPTWAWQLPALNLGYQSVSYEKFEIPDAPGAELDTGKFNELCAAAQEKVIKFQQEPTVPNAGQPRRSLYWTGSTDMESRVQLKYHSMKKSWDHPEPASACSYDQWKAGESNAFIIPPRYVRKDHLGLSRSRCRASLAEDFRRNGLQVIVSLASIELTPERPECDQDASRFWLTDGMQNEHVAATTIVCISSDNLKPYGITFSAEADLDSDEVHGLPEDSSELEATFGLYPYDELGRWRADLEPSRWHEVIDSDEDTFDGDRGEMKSTEEQYQESRKNLTIQQLGTVLLRPGHLMTMPAVLRRSETSPIQLADPTRPGQMQLLILRLVDPNYRICSTANVPPQQYSWWLSAARVEQALNTGKLPREVADIIMHEIEDWPVGEVEALENATRRAHEEYLYAMAVDLDVGATYDMGRSAGWV